MSDALTPISRVFSLFLGPFYIVLIAAILSQSTGILMVTAVGIVAVGAAIQITLLIQLSIRMAKHETHVKFTILTVMMLIAGLSIYLAYVRQIVSHLNIPEMDWYACFSIVSVSAIFIYVTTYVLLLFSEALFVLLKDVLNLSKRFRK
jgi:hypothetical protein